MKSQPLAADSMSRAGRLCSGMRAFGGITIASLALVAFATVAAGQAFGTYYDRHDFGGTITNANGISGPDGVRPSSHVTFDAAGNMYGTAASGGAASAGLVWEITASDAYKDLHDFGGTVTNSNGKSGPDGSSPSAGITFDAAGNMYGTTSFGGAMSDGVVWEITSAGTYRDRHDFGGTITNADGTSGPDGHSPHAGVTLDAAGNMYGVTLSGGANNATGVSGMVWEITAGGAYRDLHDFGGYITETNGSRGPDGSSPRDDVTFDPSGNMYGVAPYGGGLNEGLVWKITTAGAYSDLHDFGGTANYPAGGTGPDGYLPESRVTFDSAGDMYGSAAWGGANSSGTPGGIVWELSAGGVYQDLHDFGGTVLNADGSSGPDGFDPYGPVGFDGAGNLYGAAYSGGAQNANQYSGMAWEITASGAYKDLHDFDGSVTNANGTSGPDGATPYGGVTLDATGNLYGSAYEGGGNGGGIVWELALVVNNPVPTLSAISPASALVGGRSTAVTVTGTGFIATSTVKWNGAALSTTYASATSLTAVVPASDLLTPGSYPITVENGTPGGGTSNAVSFAVRAYPVHLAGLFINPAAVTGGSTATGVIFLSGLAPAGGITVQLTSSRPGVTSVPRFVVVKQGSSTATFRLNTLPPTAATTCRITATYLTIARAGYLTVNP
ncbi:MAG: IPT/TIG domain-containing protein [Armatimonadetes bacterium]|nr:IPT/TIG domain-containing protein [Armatimonadota bacterium]MDE2205008.1 IPT/TIG domain-containing protein [Armatimonadota bacterium]